ncbi:hypothetical protein F8M41_023867 [Gigaspora margarita]|uniref:Uncharacterized protein n=1 Tax=Gigaspora margarita TaxID=4874 RepID=A0A8H4EG60_GIGMA|nr:hypothetical protein F8M41_023867 [Gigaspora margarita]
MSYARTKRGVCLYLLIIPNLILAFLCPVFEIAKLKLFSQSEGELTCNTWIEYIYLALTLSTINAFFLICCIFEYDDLAWYFKIMAIVWLIFPCKREDFFFLSAPLFNITNKIYISLLIKVIYTFFTINEMGDIPFNCPSDYPYTSSTILAGCKVREVNLICMWLYFATLIIIIPLFWSWRNASESSPSLDDSERRTGGFFSFVDKLGLLSILRRQPPRPEDEPKIKPEVIFEYKVGTAESPTEV